MFHITLFYISCLTWALFLLLLPGAKPQLTGDAHVIRMQVILAEGLGWPGSLGHGTARHVVLTLTTPSSGLSETGLGPLSDFDELPLSGQQLYVRSGSASPVSCNIDKGDGSPEFISCDFSLNSSHVFTTNSLGRVSFSLTNADDVQGGNLLYVRSDSMKPDEWYRFHTDYHDLFLLSQINKESLLQVKESMNVITASTAASAIKSVAKRAMNFQVQDKNSLLGKRSHMPLAESSKLYDHRRNYAFGERILGVDPVNDAPFLSRQVVYTGKLLPHEQQDRLHRRQTPGQQLYASLLSAKKNHTILSADHLNQWGVGLNRQNKLVHFFRNMKAKIIQTVAECWQVIKSIFKVIGIPFIALKEKIKVVFRFDEIRRTHDFLDIFYNLLLPLGVRGLSLVNNRYKEFIVNSTESTDHLFSSAIKHMGGHDVTLDKLSTRGILANSTKLGQEGISKSLTPMNADARTHFLHDRILNNMEHHLIDFKNTTLWQRLKDVLKEASKGLERAFDKKTLRAAYPHVLEFAKGTSLGNITIAKLLNFLRSFMTLGTGIATNVFEVGVQLLPAYWNVAVAILTIPLKIPFLDRMLSHKIGPKKKPLTPLSILTWIGSTFATWQYMVSNRGKGPFRDIDITVLSEVKDPEFFLHSWNNDPRTSAVGKPQWIQHRLGIYDWIPRIHRTAIGTIQVLSIDAVILVAGVNPADPGAWNKPGLIFEVLSNVMFRVQGYPFTQLNTTDPKELERVRMNPDPRFLGWWTWWLIEDVFRLSRTFLPAAFNNYPLAAIANVFIVGIPCTKYGIPVTIATGKDIAKSDIPRKVVLGTMWTEMALTYVGLVFPFIQELGAKRLFMKKQGVSSWEQMPSKGIQLFNRHMSIINLARSLASSTMAYIRNIVITTNHIIGMLSSSYQGSSGSGDGRRPADM